MAEQSRADFLRAELIILPLVLLLLWGIYRRLRAALLTLGIGLGVDCGLFMIFRSREELRRGLPREAALAATLRGAGRTVFFPGVAVAAALAVLFVFPYPFLSSFAYAGIAVVVAVAVVVVAAALTVMPAAPDWLYQRPGVVSAG